MSAQNVIETGQGTRPASHVKSDVAHSLLAALERDCKAYCVLSGYERLPDAFDTDIDFMVNYEDFAKMPSILAHVANQTGTRLFQSVDHETTGRAYFLGSVQGASLNIVQPDCASDYSHFGRMWLTADEVLAARRWHRNGFWIPSAAHEFAYYLIKRLNKSDFSAQHGRKLHFLYLEDVSGCAIMLGRFFPPSLATEIAAMAALDDWSALMSVLPRYREALMRKAPEPFGRRLESLPHRAAQFFRRIIEPTGSWIALMGPDGCGKSLVLNALSKELAPAFREIKRYHMRPRVIGRKPAKQGPVTDPHGQPPRGWFASIAKVFDLAADYTVGYFSVLLPAMIRTKMILFDRCFFDVVVDSKRIRYGGPQWLLYVAARIVPGPDLVILLDAPADVLWARKREVPLEEVARQRKAYVDLTRKLPNAVIVNADQPPAAVIHDTLQTVVAFLEQRAAERLDLDFVPDRSADMKAPG